jgi:ABC-type lipoprotein release transport system permease subunit
VNASKTYIIEYIVYLDNKQETRKTKVKKCMSDLHAKIKLGAWLEKKHTKFSVTKCYEDVASVFGNLFGKYDNPFNFK